MLTREFERIVLLIFILFLPLSLSYGQVKKKDKEDIDVELEKTDSMDTKQQRLLDVIDYISDDQIHERKNKMSYLLRNAVVTYTNMKIQADYIEINWETGYIYAEGVKDSLGMIKKQTIFTQNGKDYEQDAVRINFKTKVGVAYNVRLTEGEGVLIGKRVKRVTDSVMYLRGADYTTDKYFIEKKTNEPDLVLRIDKAKYIDGKKNKTLITGPIQMRIYDVPTPLVAPFGFIPMGDKRSAGILIPTFGERRDVGFFLEGLGYYIPIGEYVDLSLTSELYTKGSWGAHALSSYRKRYSFSGDFRFDYENRIVGIKGLSSSNSSGSNVYSKSTLYRLNWTHSQDPKANPSLTFSANVNFSSSKYYRNGINNANILDGSAYNNTASSSISLSKNFDNSPFSMALTMSHSQNFNSTSNEPAPIYLTLPQLTVNMSRIYPFAPKIGAKKGLLQNMAVDYNFNAQNSITTNEDELFKSEMWKSSKNGAKHRLNLNTGVTLANYFPVTFSASYNEVWYLESMRRSYDYGLNKIVDADEKGFSSYRTFNMSTNVSTNLYATHIAKNEAAKIQGIRHVITPSVGFSYAPDFASSFWGYYNYYRDQNGRKKLYSKYANGIYGAPSQGLNASMNFSVSNNLEMKIKSDSEDSGYKKIKIFDYLTASSSYNFAADSLKLSPISINGSTSFFDQKLKIGFSGILDPYKVVYRESTNTYSRIDKIGKLRLTSFQVNTGYDFDNKTFSDKEFDKKKYKRKGSVRNEDFYFDEYDYAHFAIPWRLGVQFRYSETKSVSSDVYRSVTFDLSGSISPSPYWTITGDSSYDMEAKEFAGTRFSLTRDLRSFNMTFSWVPFGIYKTWSFFIGVKASILSDAVKYDQKSSNALSGTL